MYHAHFGLERSLFGDGIATETAVFRTPKHDRLVAHFKLALASPTSAIVLHGPAGVGKTTLTAAALRASSTRLALAWIGGMASNAAELLELILIELGINTLRTTRIERLQLWRQFQAETRATDSRLFIVAERTEDLSAEVLHALDQLTAPDAVGNSGANLVLLGHAGIDEHLAGPLLDSLRQRIRFRTELEPFTEAELQDYLRHQVECSGGSYDRIFAPGTVAALHRYTRGVARLANTLCESALDIAAVQQHKQLTAELVAKTAVSLLGLPEPGWPNVPSPAPLPRARRPWRRPPHRCRLWRRPPHPLR
jgi:type II secretory pathway predicted ATPase ExeA